ncbi:hypothetical protein MC885_002836 [Smutsia gigantea]|nr:hypothetical protein MC885_002836 [Smutsia gigantea]
MSPQGLQSATKIRNIRIPPWLRALGWFLVGRAAAAPRASSFAQRSRSVSRVRGRARELPGTPEAGAAARGRWRGSGQGRGRWSRRRGGRGRAARVPSASAVGGGAHRSPPQVLQQASAQGGLQDAAGRQHAGQARQTGAVAISASEAADSLGARGRGGAGHSLGASAGQEDAGSSCRKRTVISRMSAFSSLE